MELRPLTGGQQYQSHVIFSTGRFCDDSLDPLVWKRKVAGSWHDVLRSDEMKGWANKAFAYAAQWILTLAGRTGAAAAASSPRELAICNSASGKVLTSAHSDDGLALS